MIEEGRALGLAAIEMESAALYAFAAAKARPVLCFAHVTNTMAVTEVDFEKGDAQGALDSLRLLDALLSGGLARGWALAIPPAQETVPSEADTE